jgi:hypothetical protein
MATVTAARTAGNAAGELPAAARTTGRAAMAGASPRRESQPVGMAATTNRSQPSQTRPAIPICLGKPMALLLTSGGEEADNADMVIRGFQYMVEYLKARMVGHLFVSGCTNPEEM